MQLGPYRYALRSLGESSAKFGPCEVCGQWVSEVFYQDEERWCEIEPLPADADGLAFWTAYACRAGFGHAACLVSRRREPNIGTVTPVQAVAARYGWQKELSATGWHFVDHTGRVRGDKYTYFSAAELAALAAEVK